VRGRGLVARAGLRPPPFNRRRRTSSDCASSVHDQAIDVANSQDGQERNIETPAVFSFIGAMPRTDWLPSEIERDAKAFVRTGSAVAQSVQFVHEYLNEM